MIPQKQTYKNKQTQKPRLYHICVLVNVQLSLLVFISHGVAGSSIENGLPWKPEGLSLTPRIHVKRQGWLTTSVIAAFVPCHGKLSQEGWPGAQGPASLLHSVQNEKDAASKQGEGKNQLSKGCFLTPTSVPWYAYAPSIHIFTHTHYKITAILSLYQ